MSVLHSSMVTSLNVRLANLGVSFPMGLAGKRSARLPTQRREPSMSKLIAVPEHDFMCSFSSHTLSHPPPLGRRVLMYIGNFGASIVTSVA